MDEMERARMAVKENYEFFERNFDELYKKYPEKFLVLKDQAVITAFHDFDSAADYGIKTFGLGNFSVQQCTPRKNRIAFSSRRVIFARI